MNTNFIEISGKIISQEEKFTTFEIDDSTFILPNSSIQVSQTNEKIFIDKTSILFQIIDNKKNKPIIWGKGFIHSEAATIYDDCQGDCDCRCECRCDCQDCDCRCECRCDCQGGDQKSTENTKENKVRQQTTEIDLN